jgi:hypothetical protein
MLRTVCFLVLSLALQLAGRRVEAHALLNNPMPRDQQDGYKDPPMTPPGTGAPCGISEASSQPHNTLTAGAPITVTWSETINHPGCFVIDFSAANDQSFQILGVKSHMNPPAPTSPTKAKPRMWSLDVTLPSTPCPKCTLRLRQLMLTSDVTADKCPPASIPNGSTYYSCSNVALTATSTGAGGTGGATTGAGGTGGSARGGSGGTTGVAGTVGQGGSIGGPAGQTGTTAGAGGTSVDPSGAAGRPIDPSGVAGSSPTGLAGSPGPGAAGHASTGAAGSSSTGAAGQTGGNDDAGGGCATATGTSPLALLLMAGLLSRRRSRRSRS